MLCELLVIYFYNYYELNLEIVKQLALAAAQAPSTGRLTENYSQQEWEEGKGFKRSIEM